MHKTRTPNTRFCKAPHMQRLSDMYAKYYLKTSASQKRYDTFLEHLKESAEIDLEAYIKPNVHSFLKVISWPKYSPYLSDKMTEQEFDAGFQKVYSDFEEALGIKKGR